MSPDWGVASASNEYSRPGREKGEDVMGGKGWWALGWSFLASGALTVRTVNSSDHTYTDLQFFSFLFPALFAIPVFDVLSLPFGTSLAANWMWL